MSLAETVVAAVLLSLVIMAVLNLFPDTMALVQRNRQESSARYAAQSELESTAALPFQKIALGTFAIPPDRLPRDSTGQLVVDTVDNVPVSRLKRLRVEIVYRSARGEKTVSEELYVHSVRR